MLFDGNRFSHRLTACLLIYALVILDFVPFARALNDMEVRNLEFARRNYSDLEGLSTDHENTIQANLELNSMEGTSSPALPIANAPGGGQVESSGFSIGSSDGLVDKFTGDFTYSLPLMDVEGYPITLSYNSNVTMMEEASWVGLGWNLNVGSVSREMRGIPDEFNGEQVVTKTMNILNEETIGDKYGGYVGAGKEIKKVFYPVVQLTLLTGKYNSNYLGYAKTFDIGLQAKLSIGDEFSVTPAFGLGYSSDSKNGSYINTSFDLNFAKKYGEFSEAAMGLSYGKTFSSRSGVVAKSIGLNFSGIKEKRIGTTDNSKGAGGGYGATTALNYGSITMVPGSNYYSAVSGNQLSTTAFFRGAEVLGLIAEAGLIYQRTSISHTINLGASQIFSPAIGFFHSGKRDNFATQNWIKPIMDFNKSELQEYSEEMVDLNFSMQTYDVFRVSAMGIGGTFRGRRTDFGTYFDASNNSDVKIKSRDISAGFQALPIPKVIVSYAEGNNSGRSESGAFTVNGTHPIDFINQSNSDDFDNSVYFKMSGETTPEDLSAYNLMGGTEAKFFDVVKQGSEISLTSNLYSDFQPNSYSTINSLALNQQIGQTVKATYVNPMTAVDRMLQPNNQIAKVAFNQFPPQSVNYVARNSGCRENNHLSEIETVSTNGMRYHFGIPAYTISESSVVFAAEGLSVNTSTGIVTYGPSDNTVNNTKGRSHFYEKTTVPSYAHSFLLTQILSPDYIDRTGDGPSIDDIGSYYKFNYSQAYGESTPYNWRFPVAGGSGNEAIHHEGLLGTELDDMGTYSYSEKEIWYTHSIETKNLVAEFHLKERKDAYSVQGENGILDTGKPLYALDSIVLYNKADREANGSAAIPLQTVVFVYDYSLCKNAPANKHTYSPNIDYDESGKLTLKHVRIFGGKSSESGLRSYDFTYSSGPENPDFNYAAVDGWGNYKENNAVKPNSLFPYAVQDETTAQENVESWKLISIENPAGGRIDIEYAPDSYSYVQNKRAMRHFEIVGLTNIIRLLKSQNEASFSTSDLVNTMESNISGLITSEGGSDNLTNGAQTVKYSKDFGIFDKDHFPNNVIVFELEDPIVGTTSFADACTEVRDKYFREASHNGEKLMTQLYVKFLFNVKSSVQEIMPVFLDISGDYAHALSGKLNYHDGFSGIGVMPVASGSTNYEYGYVVVNPASNKKWRSGSKKYAKNPMQIAAVQFSRQSLPDVIYGSCATCTPDNAIDGQVLLGKEIDFVMVDLDYASSLDLSRSILRTYEPDNEKLGGNSRVKQIVYKDNWDAISGEYESSYSWTYSYPSRNEQSGVSTNEPRSMKDESPLYMWNSYENVVQKFPNEMRYSITPETGLLYPEAVVGYSETTVHFNGTKERGYSINQFYTAKDYPVITDKTVISKSARVNKKNLLLGKSVDLFGLSQGFSIITNEWHGAVKSSKLVDGSGALLSQSTYKYANWDEEQKMISRDGGITNENVGIEYDIHGYSNFLTDNSKSIMIGASVKIGIPIPIPIPSPIFSISSRERGFYSYVLNKHINYTPQVKSIQTINMQSVNEAENLAYDYHTGDVLVSSLKDEFDDKLYSVSTPGHWYYEPFKEVSGVNGFSCSGTISSSVLTVAPANKPKFNIGDKLFVHNGGTVYSVWISEIDGSGNFVLIDQTGALFTILSGSVTAIIAKSLHQNRLSEKIQQAVTKRTPDIYDSQFEFPDTTVISSSAITFGERNSYICGTASEGADNDVSPGSTFNPFLYGTKGNLVPDGQYSWQSERVQADHEHGIRFDGTYSDFFPFYQINTADDSWYRINESSHPDHNGGDLYQKWRKGGEIAWFDEFGKPIESKDQIGVHSAVLYSYNNEAKLLPVAQAVNAKLQDIAFDGFEDYDLNLPTLNADQTHFDYKDAIGSHVAVSSTIRHSGRASLKVNPGYLASVSKLVGTLCDEKTTLTSDETFTVDSCFCIPPFQPTPGDYILSVWVKVDTTANVLDYSDAEVEVDITGTGSANYLFTADGPILDGWQRLEGEFTIPSNAAGITVKLKNESGTQDVYFDDLRIHPFLAGMTTNVYHPQTLLPIASHDGYNFTTFYNYDENLNQVRVRVETSEGIKTIVETETGGKKNYSPQ